MGLKYWPCFFTFPAFGSSIFKRPWYKIDSRRASISEPSTCYALASFGKRNVIIRQFFGWWQTPWAKNPDDLLGAERPAFPRPCSVQKRALSTCVYSPLSRHSGRRWRTATALGKDRNRRCFGDRLSEPIWCFPEIEIPHDKACIFWCTPIYRNLHWQMPCFHHNYFVYSCAVALWLHLSKPSNTGWWFGTWLAFSHSVGNFIIPTDELIFFRISQRCRLNHQTDHLQLMLLYRNSLPC